MNPNLHRVIGIDLGTTYSAVAAFNSFSEQAQIIPNPEDAANPSTTPSVLSVLKPTGMLVVGRPAKNNLPNNPLNTVIEIKREMGEMFREDTLDKFRARGMFRAKTSDDEGDAVKVNIHGKWFTPQEVSALILMKMKWIAEQEMGGQINDAVITVPAYFKERQKKATEEAARLAGLYPRQIIPEPTAAAICYGVDQFEPTRKVYVVYDLGGGTFDVSIITVEEQNISVIATSGDPRLGGGDFDDKITEWAVQKLQQQFGLDVSADVAAKARIKLLAEKAKIDLSNFESTTLNLTELNPANPPLLKLERSEFVEMIEPLLNKSLGFVDQAVKMAEAQKGVRPEDINAILLVGGSSKIPRVRTRLLEYFQKDESFLRTNLDPDAVVARGAAIMATRFQPSANFDISKKAETTFVVTDVAQDVQISLITEHSLGIGVQDNLVKRIVEQGTNIPVSITEGGFSNSGPGTHLMVPVYQGEGQFSYENTLIGELAIGPMEPKPAGTHQFEVTFTLNRDGLLSMMVRHINEGKTYQATFEQKTGIKEKDLGEVRSKLVKLWTEGFGANATEAAAPRPAQPAPRPNQVPPVAPPQSTTEAAPVSADAKLIEPSVEVPEQFKQVLRRVQRQLQKDTDPELLQAYTAFVTRLNGGAREEDLEELGDELADVFDTIRR